MYDEKFELLEAKIRETAMLVSRLREEKRHLEGENEQLRVRVVELEARLESSNDVKRHHAPPPLKPLEQLDTLQPTEASLPAPPSPPEAASLPIRESPPLEDHLQRGLSFEQQGQYEQAMQAYQHALERDGDHLEASQRLAFLLEKLNRDAEAATVWEKIWSIRDGQPAPRRRRLR